MKNDFNSKNLKPPLGPESALVGETVLNYEVIFDVNSWEEADGQLCRCLIRSGRLALPPDLLPNWKRRLFFVFRKKCLKWFVFLRIRGVLSKDNPHSCTWIVFFDKLFCWKLIQPSGIRFVQSVGKSGFSSFRNHLSLKFTAAAGSLGQQRTQVVVGTNYKNQKCVIF
jgi:hypothetical protein